ncbi:hypothetical protein ACFOY2_49280 [Nonomuraea purpurea]|uniref:Uncharacterized protein n=1 Tax=Nonomuraea purpurea TaxID=1849276 RepID=A0ABV8GSI0_9ACTN
MRWFALFVLMLVVSGVVAPTPTVATATAIHGFADWGNGKRNKSYMAVNSPTNMRGAQQISVSISGKTRTQAAYCKRRARICKISQRMGY